MSILPFQPPKLTAGSAHNLDPLDGRYFDAEIARYLSEEARIAYQAHVEAALAHTLADFKICPRSVAAEITKASRTVTTTAVSKEEATTKHDIKALVNVIKAKVSPEAAAFVHLTATSYDIVSTASAMQYRDTTQQVIGWRLRQLITTLAEKVLAHAETVQIGRTHGQHGVPITFGFALSEYLERIGSSAEIILSLAGSLPGKFSGAVGAYNASGLFFSNPLEFEKRLLAKLDLKPAGHSTQIVPPEPLVRLLDELSNVAGAMANLAHDMRHLQRSEIAEIREAFDERQTGSSTMAHKRNPVSFENVASQFKQVLGQLVSAKLNLISEHQRDLTDSAAARFYPVLFASVAHMAKRLEAAMARLSVDEAAMRRNLNLSAGVIGAEPLYLLLSKYGHPQAHEAAKALAHRALDDQASFAQVVKADAELSKYWPQFTAAEKTIIEAPEKHYTGLAAERATAIAKRWSRS